MAAPVKRLYKSSSRRAEWKRMEKHGEAAVLIKGTNRRVIVVRSPDPKLFEEAIFVLRDDGQSPQDAGLVLEQATRAAGDYLKSCGVTAVRKRRKPAAVIAAICLVLACLAIAIWYLLN